MKNQPRSIRSLPILFAFVMTMGIHAQEDKKPFLDDFRGAINVTNNGLSIVPSFSLGDPAIGFDLKFFKKGFSFEPDLRFALEGKPWSFVFWLRYKAIQKERFSLRVGAHPSITFRTSEIFREGATEEIIEARRYVAFELAPSYTLAKNVSMGMYYLRGHGFDEGMKELHFLALNAAISKIGIANGYHFNVAPQVYYLKTDDLDGTYAAATITFAKEGFPLSLSAVLNKGINTRISPDDDFQWNLSLFYSFPK